MRNSSDFDRRIEGKLQPRVLFLFLEVACLPTLRSELSVNDSANRKTSSLLGKGNIRLDCGPKGFVSQVNALARKAKNLDLVQADVTRPEIDPETDSLDRIPVNFLVSAPVFLPNLGLFPNLVSVLSNALPDTLSTLLMLDDPSKTRGIGSRIRYLERLPSWSSNPES